MVEVKPERPEPTYILRLVQIATILLTPFILFFTLTLIQINRCSIELENDTKIVDFVQKPLIGESNHDQSHFPEQVNDIPLTPPGIDESLLSTSVDLFPQSPEEVHSLDVIFTPSKDIAKFNPQPTPEEIRPFEQIFKPENSFPIMDAWNPDGQISSTIVQKLFDELNKDDDLTYANTFFNGDDSEIGMGSDYFQPEAFFRPLETFESFLERKKRSVKK